MHSAPRPLILASGSPRRLSGRERRVVTGLALVDAAGGASRQAAVNSRVRLRSLGDDGIAAYVITSEPHDKAGAHPIQGTGGGLIAEMDGCWTNVVGLPLRVVERLLTEADVVMPAT